MDLDSTSSTVTHAGEGWRPAPATGLAAADQPLLRPAGHRRVDDHPVVAEPDHRRRWPRPARSISSSVSGSPCSASCQSKENSESGPKSPSISGSSCLPDPGAEHGHRGQVAAQAARPQHVDAAGLERRQAVLEQVGELDGVEGDLVGHPQLEQPVEHRPGVGRGPQRDAGVGAGPVAEAVRGLGSGLGPEQRGVGEVQRVALVVDLEHQPDAAADQLALVGLDPQAQRDQVRAVVLGGTGVPGQPAGQPVGEPGLPDRPRRPGWATGRRRGASYGDGAGLRPRPRHRVGHRVHHRAHQRASGPRPRREPGPRRGARAGPGRRRRARRSASRPAGRARSCRPRPSASPAARRRRAARRSGARRRAGGRG